MVINFIVPEISRTGGMRIIFEYANRLKHNGHDVALYSPMIPFYPYKGKIKRHFIKHQVRHAAECLKRNRMPPENIFSYNFDMVFPWVINNLTVRDADAVVATSWTSAFAVNKLSRKKGRKFYFIQDYESWNASVKHVDMTYGFNMKRITVSDYLKNLLLEKFGSDSEVILNGIDMKRFGFPEREYCKPRNILFTDHILKNKNTEGAIEIVSRLKQDHPELSFRCFGTGKYHDMPGFVEFNLNPSDSEIHELYRKSDIFIYTSLYEGFGLPPAEAMASGSVLAGYSVAAVPQFAEHMKSAILCEAGHSQGLIYGVSYLISDPPAFERISREGVKSIREKLDWNKSVAKLTTILENA